MRAQERETAEGLLYADLYQLTMAQLYYFQGLHEQEAQFDYFFRTNPDYGEHQAGYCVFAGLDDLLGHLEDVAVRPEDVELLRGLRTGGGDRLFQEDFLDWLTGLGDLGGVQLRAVDEGRVVHPGTPLVIARGPLAVVQLLESALLNLLNFPTLIATKAARLRQAAGDAVVSDFGLRRGQGRGVTAGSRAALIGGADTSSNTGASILMGVAPAGTHAHSMVQAFIANGGSELDAFRAYAEVYPNDCLLLIDTVDTLHSGLPNAITVFEELRTRGHEPRGIRLDSGDLAHLAVACAAELDRAGFPAAAIVLSNQLDELTIMQVRSQVEAEAKQLGLEAQRVLGRLSYGVGTRLMVSEGAPALDGVFKLVATRAGSEWRPAIKVSDSPAKTVTPGPKSLWRVYDDCGRATADLIALDSERPQPDSALTLHHPGDPQLTRVLPPRQVGRVEPLLAEVWNAGRRLAPEPGIATLRERRLRDEAALDIGVRRLLNPHVYHVSLSKQLWDLKRRTIAAAGRAP